MELHVLGLEGNVPRAWGEVHGESYRREIGELYEIRLSLALEHTALENEARVLSLAERHLPLLETFDAALYEELLGIAAGAGLTPAHIVLLNHYTDLRDIDCATLHESADPGGCSSIYAPTVDGPVLAQTWDMHASAADYGLLLDVPGPTEGKRSVLFTITGCLGMTGLAGPTAAGSWLGITINNLTSVDARIGVVWPALVRRALRAPDAASARDMILGAALGSGHHYMVADGSDFYGIECSGARKKVTQCGAQRTHFHTNHCLDPEMIDTAIIPDGSSTLARYARLRELAAAGFPCDARGLYETLTDVAIPQPGADAPHAPATCGALAMELSRGRITACAGSPAEAKPHVIDLAA